MGNIWAFILLIGPLIFFHELGHLIAAKLVDVKVLRFSIGFGPPLVRVRFGETEYCLAPIPLGGYVQMLGQMPGDDIPPQDQDRALSAKPLWARYFVLGAGPLANLVLPVFCLFFLFLQQTTLTPAVIGTVLPGSAAEQAGLVQGDRIVAIDGRDVRSWTDMSQRIADAPGADLKVQIERDGKRLDRVVTPQKKMARNDYGVVAPIGRLGVLSSFYAPQIGITDPKSPAYLEGLRTGDTITSINGEPVHTIEELQRMLDSTGDALVRLTYLRPRSMAAPLGRLLWYESAHAQLLPGRGTGTGILPANAFVRSVDAGSPAERAGMRPDDRVLVVDGEPLTQWQTLYDVIVQRREQPITLTVQALGEAPREITLQLEFREWRDIYKQDHKELWFGAEPYGKIHSSAPEPIRGRFTYAIGAAINQTRAFMSATWTSLVQMLTFEKGVEDLSSVIGIFKVAGTAADQGPGDFLTLVVLLSINLALVNLLPIPVLDGGHLLFFTIEAVRRRPLSQRAREIASAIGLVIILLLLLVAARNDIVRYWL